LCQPGPRVALRGMQDRHTSGNWESWAISPCLSGCLHTSSVPATLQTHGARAAETACSVALTKSSAVGQVLCARAGPSDQPLPELRARHAAASRGRHLKSSSPYTGRASTAPRCLVGWLPPGATFRIPSPGCRCLQRRQPGRQRGRPAASKGLSMSVATGRSRAARVLASAKPSTADGGNIGQPTFWAASRRRSGWTGVRCCERGAPGWLRTAPARPPWPHPAALRQPAARQRTAGSNSYWVPTSPLP
jgi:hypothetical protein